MPLSCCDHLTRPISLVDFRPQNEAKHAQVFLPITQVLEQIFLKRFSLFDFGHHGESENGTSKLKNFAVGPFSHTPAHFVNN